MGHKTHQGMYLCNSISNNVSNNISNNINNNDRDISANTNSSGINTNSNSNNNTHVINNRPSSSDMLECDHNIQPLDHTNNVLQDMNLGNRIDLGINVSKDVSNSVMYINRGELWPSFVVESGRIIHGGVHAIICFCV